MSKRRQEADQRDIIIRQVNAMRKDEKVQALNPLQDVNELGNRVLTQCMIVRFEDIQINRWKSRLNAQQTRGDNAYTKKKLIAEIKHYENSKEAALCALGKMVYEPVISIMNAQDIEYRRQTQQQQQQSLPTFFEQQQQHGGRKKRTRRKRKRNRKSRRRKKR